MAEHVYAEFFRSIADGTADAIARSRAMRGVDPKGGE